MVNILLGRSGLNAQQPVEEVCKQETEHVQIQLQDLVDLVVLVQVLNQGDVVIRNAQVNLPYLIFCVIIFHSI